MTNFTGTIVTLGGGGFSQEGAVTPIDEHILELTRAERPRVCFVPTASGDDLGYAAKFEQAFAGRTETSVLSLFTKSANANWTCDPPPRPHPGRRLRRRWVDGQPARDLAHARPARPPARSRGERHRPGRYQRRHELLVRGVVDRLVRPTRTPR